MNRNLLLVFVAFCLLSNTVALRGALFRSGRSILHRQNLNDVALTQPHLFAPSEKRAPVVELYPVVDSGNMEPADSYPSYFRI